ALSFPYRRFWCRNLCPAGAFLALLNRPRILRRLSPPTHPARCDLGVRNAEELDCIRCDRCAHENK
ncbi:MAG TPA: 4Fe-4S binding protein, partial [Candidatus Hydrogenedentes bacterium]|nr:4Fe-4S binding protein [Candidatus Hydrogenedentota bacterium]